MKFTERVAHFGSPQGTLRLLLHGPNLVKLYWRVFTDRRVSIVPKAVLVLGLAYFVLPIDFIPDFPLIGIGQLDDIALLAFALKAFISMSPRSVVEEHVQLIDQGA
ncbi:MAG: YkvA family protein [Bacteroidota bacterium]